MRPLSALCVVLAVLATYSAAAQDVVGDALPIYSDAFDRDVVIEESGSMAESRSPKWWVNSGARFIVTGGTGQTIQGTLADDDYWRVRYAMANPVDTEDGYRPQNIFRLIQRQLWKNFRQSVYFQIRAVNLTDSPNRDASNGVLLFNRYVDSDNLYYAGVRVDGRAVIKKKIRGTYYTLASKALYPGPRYDRSSNPNLIPVDRWIGVSTIVHDRPGGGVDIRLFVDNAGTGDWRVVLEATDDGRTFGGPPIAQAGYGGIRTDFMDVELDDYVAVAVR